VLSQVGIERGCPSFWNTRQKEGWEGERTSRHESLPLLIYSLPQEIPSRVRRKAVADPVPGSGDVSASDRVSHNALGALRAGVE
jgi:hypothetical protein